MKKNQTSASGRVVKILLYGLCVVLVLFYVLVLWWGKHPEVGLEYRMYYLTHELSDWPGYGKLAYKLGTDEYCSSLKDRSGADVAYTVCRRKGQGWEKEQYDGSTNNGGDSWIYYRPDQTRQAVDYTVEVPSFSGGGTVEVYADSEKIGTITAAGTYVFTVPRVSEGELLTIRFSAQDCAFRVWRVRLG